MNKRKYCMTAAAFLLIAVLAAVPVSAEEALNGYYKAQAENDRYEFKNDGTVVYNGTEGIYTISGDLLTVIAGGYAYRYNFEMIGDLLILYRSDGIGVVFDREDPAEATGQENGLPYDLKWGMSEEQILGLVPGDPVSHAYENGNVAMTTDAEVEGKAYQMTGEGYFLENDGLTMIVRMFHADAGFDPELFEQIKREQNMAAAEVVTADKAYATKVMTKAEEGYEPDFACDPCMWNVGETQVLLLAEEFSGASSTYYCIFLSPEYVQAVSE